MYDGNDKEYHAAFGAHSNIPGCCIDFFIREWDRIWNDRNHPYTRAVRASDFGYVPCPACLAANNRVRVRQCENECGGPHRDDFKARKAAI